PHPRLTLTADHLTAPHLELEVHGREVATERENLETDALFLDPRSGRARDAEGVDRVEAVAVLGHRVADRVRAVPERRVEHVDVLVDERLLVALEQRADLGHHLGHIGRHVDHRLASIAFATATRAASLPRAPRMDSPTGSPSTS